MTKEETKEEILREQIKFLKEKLESEEADNYNLRADYSFIQRCRADDQVEKRVAKAGFRMMFILFIIELVFIFIKL